MDKQIQELLEAHNAGRISRRTFIQRAALILGGTTAGLAVAAGDHDHADAQEGTPAATMAATEDPNIKLVTKMVDFPTATQPAPGYLAYPESGGPFPAAVVIQEWWGLDGHIKSVVERMARNGFAAIAPDLYRGEVATEPNEAQKLAMALVMDQAIKDIQGAADYLTAQDYVTPKKAGVMGFCFGGGIAMRMTWLAGTDIGAVVVFYGAGIDPTDDDFKAVKVPVLGLYGANDGSISTANIKKWEAKFKEFGKINEMVIYDGAGHAFFNDTRPSYNADAAKDAFKRTLAWFNKYLLEGPAEAATAAATGTK